MKKYSFGADFLLLITAIIWGFAFVAQRMGMEFVGPFTFNAIRFALGGISLFPLIWFTKKTIVTDSENANKGWQKKYGGILLGIVLFTGASLQQVGIVYTTAGNAGFITGLYVVFVPMMSLFWGQQTKISIWIGAAFAVAGLFLLSVTDKFTISYGDLIVLTGAIFWAGHVHIIGYLSPKMNAIKLAQTQFFTCSVLSFGVAFIFEKITLASTKEAMWPILYGGLLSVGIAYTLQVVAQKKAHPARAAIILSMEAMFAALGGWIVLHEMFSLRAIIGCSLMFAGMIFAQADVFKKNEKN